jgi:signal peptide peptidase SppA
MWKNLMDHSRKNKRSLILGTGLLLALVFLAVVVLFFVFSAFSTSLVGQCVAVVDISAPLTVEGMPTSLFDTGYPSSEELAYTIEGINSRDDVGAVVFDFNSPGGSVVASGTDYIVSDPDALTGSIGVIATVTQMGGLFEKLGINVTAIKSGEHKDIGSSFRNMTVEEQAIMQALVDEIYTEFRGVVVENRKGKLDLQIFNNVSDGRILSGRQAKTAGLVDELGTKKDAIMKAADLANISYDEYGDIRVCYVDATPSEGGLFSAESILKGLGVVSQVPKLSYQ